jgi:multidrug efflux pump subunit AcrA (membrane-fusion protein)
MNRRQLVIVLVLTGVIVLIISIIMSNFKPSQEQTFNNTIPVKYVKTQRVQNDTISAIIAGYGRLNSFRNVNISSEVSGRLLEGDIDLKEGAIFKKGQILFRINPEDASYSLKSRKSSFINLLVTALADIKIDFPAAYDKWYKFYESVSIEEPLPNLPETTSTKEKTYLASKNVLSEYYSIKADEARLEKYTIRAPFTGSIINVMAQPGSSVNPGSNVAQIIQQDQLEVRIPVDVDALHLIESGQLVQLTDKNNKTLPSARINRISSNINQSTQTVNVYAKLMETTNQVLVDGMYVNTEIVTGNLNNVIELPRRSLLDENMVYVLQDSQLVKTTVVIEKSNDQSVIVSGLKTGTTIVIEPVTSIRTNQKFATLKAS